MNETGAVGPAAPIGPALRPFVASTVLPRTTRAVVRAPITIRYWVHDRGRDSRLLAGDPAAAHAVAPLKVALNAISTFIVFLVGGLALAASAPALFGYGSVVVVSGSMEPAIKVADVVLTTATDGLGLEQGTVIDFEHADGSNQLHRIAEATEAGYRTAGDANPTVDSDLVAPSQVRGVGAVVVPFVGLPRLWADQGLWLHLGITLVVLVSAMYMSRTRWLEDDLAALAVEAGR